ncbi:MAG: nuclear transport factor 2 family protein [Bacteroidota bacterium]
MQVWTDAWHNADAETFKSIYAENALIFPPNKPTVQGNSNILEFMKGGLGKVDVVFEAEELIIDGKLSFEYGIFKDVRLSDGKLIGQGHYSVTWILENDIWKVQSHTWSMPIKN